MADAYTTRNRFQKQESGQHNNTWGTELNSAGGSDLLDFSLDGWVSFTLSGTKTLTSANGSTDEARGRHLNVTSGTGGTVTIPSVEHFYWVRNNTSGDVIVTTGGGATATVKSGNVTGVMCDATNVYLAQVADFGSVVPKSTGTASANSELVNKGTMDAAILAAALSGELPATSLGFLYSDGAAISWNALATGILTFLGTPSSANLRAALTDETGTGGAVFATAPTLSNPIVGTQSPADNSTKAASTAYVEAAVAAAVVGLWDAKGAMDCSANPNYPAASKGDQYFVSVAGKIGGASGTTVEIGDIFFAILDNAGGTQASVGSSWLVLQANLIGALVTANALSELSGVASTARSNIGAQAELVSGTSIKTINSSSILGSGDLSVRPTWNLIDTIATTSGTEWTSATIAGTYADLWISLVGMTFASGTGIQPQILLSSDNGSNYSTAISFGQQGDAGNVFDGDIWINGYTVGRTQLTAGAAIDVGSAPATKNASASSGTDLVTVKLGAALNKIKIKFSGGNTGNAGNIYVRAR